MMLEIFQFLFFYPVHNKLGKEFIQPLFDLFGNKVAVHAYCVEPRLLTGKDMGFHFNKRDFTDGGNIKGG